MYRHSLPTRQRNTEKVNKCTVIKVLMGHLGEHGDVVTPSRRSVCGALQAVRQITGQRSSNKDAGKMAKAGR